MYNSNQSYIIHKNTNKMAAEDKTPIRLLKLKNFPNSNDHYTNPFKQGEVVQYLGAIPKKENQPATYRKQFVRIYRTRTKETMVESKKDFVKIGNWEFDDERDN